ncbi:MAG TPA: hypothetical protein PLO37_22315 [Candidatus Hydrogenedentes bacterium]|nr:hypothetical protein [Candidatus Hydrogenedentota bacterium]HPG69591.1 hypothetical protein [Candidatus Hydrogenedentota bacterium]
MRVIRCVVLMVCAAAEARACEDGSIRMAAFAEDRDVHRLCVIADAADPQGETVSTRLCAELTSLASELNITVERVPADDPAFEWQALALPSAPPERPVTVLVGWDGVGRRPFVIDHWTPAPTPEELGAIIASPVRDALREAVPTHWAALLYAPAVPPAGGQARPLIEGIAKRWTEENPPGLRVVEMDRSDPRERLLCAFIGLDPEGPDWAGIVYGKGKLMAPPFEGESITEENLNALVAKLLEPCTCLQAGTRLGVDIPLRWAKAHDKAVVALGTDAYEEAALPGVGSAPAGGQPSDMGRRLPMLALAAVAVSVLAVAAGAVVVVWQSRRGSGREQGSGRY